VLRYFLALLIAILFKVLNPPTGCTVLRTRGRLRKYACKEQVKNRRLGLVLTASSAAT
jgi:hypothetical protein